jgi:hypothetical protein
MGIFFFFHQEQFSTSVIALLLLLLLQPTIFEKHKTHCGCVGRRKTRVDR